MSPAPSAQRSHALVRIDVPHEDERLEEVRSLYDATFAEHQREPWDDMVERIHAGTAEVGVAWADQRVVGFILGHLMPGLRFGYVSHLGVDPTYRRAGVASGLAALGTDFCVRHGLRGLLVEYDHPELSTDPRTAATGATLEAIYAGWGGTVVCPTGYAMPNLLEPAVLEPMRLLWLPVAGVPATAVITQVPAMVAEIWTRIYGAATDDPRLATVLADLQVAQL